MHVVRTGDLQLWYTQGQGETLREGKKRARGIDLEVFLCAKNTTGHQRGGRPRHG